MKAPGSTGEGHSILIDLKAGEGSGIPGVVVKSPSLTWKLPLILSVLNIVEVSGICHVAVKCLDMT